MVQSAPAFIRGEVHAVIALRAHNVRMRSRSRAATIAPRGRSVPVGYVSISDGVRFSSVLLKEEET